MPTELLVSGIAMLSAIIVALIKYFETTKNNKLATENSVLKSEIAELKKHKAELMRSFSALDVLMNAKIIDVVREKVAFIFSKTRADRFLLLYVMNGKEMFNFVTCTLEQHKPGNPNVQLSIGAVQKFSNSEIDPHYQVMVKQLEAQGVLTLCTETMPECQLKSYYLDEKVNHSILKFLARIHMDEDNDIVAFCSLATHELEPYTKLEQDFIKLGVDAIRTVTKSL